MVLLASCSEPFDGTYFEPPCVSANVRAERLTRKSALMRAPLRLKIYKISAAGGSSAFWCNFLFLVGEIGVRFRTDS